MAKKGTHLSEETKNKMREVWTDEHKQKMSLYFSGENNPFYGKHHTEESNEKNSLAHLGKVGTKHTPESKNKLSLANKGKKKPEGFGDKMKAENNPYWKGGKYYREGYIYIYKPGHPLATQRGYVPEHRLVMEEVLGRYLLPEEVAHHINKIRDDNRIENLMLFENVSKHQKHHALLGELFK